MGSVLRRLLPMSALAATLFAGTIAASDGRLRGFTEGGDELVFVFAYGAISQLNVNWASDGVCGQAEDLHLTFCANCPDMPRLVNGKVTLDDAGAGVRLQASFTADSGAGWIDVGAIAGCNGDRLSWSTEAFTQAGRDVQTSIASASWARLKTR